MATPTRRLAFTKKVGLADLSEGWGECYAVVRPAARAEYKKMMDTKTFSKLDTEAQLKMQDDFVMDHLVSGKVLIETEAGKHQLDDLQREDIENTRPLCNLLYYEIMGLNYDPKDL